MVKSNYKSKRKQKNYNKKKKKSLRYGRKKKGGTKKIQKGGFFNPISFILDKFIPSPNNSSKNISLNGGSIKQFNRIRNNYNNLIRK